jgi:hypothetical protein
LSSSATITFLKKKLCSNDLALVSHFLYSSLSLFFLLSFSLLPSLFSLFSFHFNTYYSFVNAYLQLEEPGYRSRYGDSVRAGRSGVRVPVGSRIFFSVSSRPTLGSTQPIQWVPGALSPGVKLITHLKLVPRSRKCGSIHPLPIRLHMAQCLISSAQGQLIPTTDEYEKHGVAIPVSILMRFL